MTPKQLIVKTMYDAVQQSIQRYRQASADHAAMKARREVYIQMSDPMDGIGGIDVNPYRQSTVEEAAKRETSCAEEFAKIAEAYQLAVYTFIE